MEDQPSCDIIHDKIVIYFKLLKRARDYTSSLVPQYKYSIQLQENLPY